MITANVTVDVKCDTVEEANEAKAKLEGAGFEIIPLLDPRNFQAEMQQVLNKEEA